MNNQNPDISINYLLQERYEAIHNKIERIKSYYKKKRDELQKERDDDIEKLKDYLTNSGQSIGHSISNDVAGQVQDEIEEKGRRIRALYVVKSTILNKQEMMQLMKIKKFERASKGALIASGIILGGKLIHDAYIEYQKEMKRIKGICSKQNGEKKALCLHKYKIKLLKKRLVLLESLIENCNKSSDPGKCKIAIKKEIEKIKNLIKKEVEIIGKEFTSSGDWGSN